MKVEFWPITKPREHPRNARLHPPAQVGQLAASIAEFGFVNPILVDSDGWVIAGHGRLLGARKAGLAEVPVIVLSGLTQVQADALRIADNRIAANARWDENILMEEIGKLKELNFDIPLLGFTPAEMADLTDQRLGQSAGEDDIPQPCAKEVTRRGDIWLLGDHRLGCGDSTDGDFVRAVLAGSDPHIMVTDPPYGVEYDAGWRNRAERTVVGGRAVGIVLNDNRADWREAWQHFRGDVAYVWYGGVKGGTVQASLEACGFELRAQLIWVKPRHVLGRGNYHYQHEPCFYAIKRGGKAHWRGSRDQTSVWNISHAKSETGHSTQKPVEAMRRPIENNSKPGDFVYEPFSGSGTTIIACQTTKRLCRAIELSSAYVDVAVQRWQGLTGLEATLEETGKAFAEVASSRSEQ